MVLLEFLAIESRVTNLQGWSENNQSDQFFLHTVSTLTGWYANFKRRFATHISVRVQYRIIAKWFEKICEV